MFIQASLMTDKQVNLIWLRSSSESSGGSTDSDYNSDRSDENAMNEPLLKNGQVYN